MLVPVELLNLHKKKCARSEGIRIQLNRLGHENPKIFFAPHIGDDVQSTTLHEIYRSQNEAWVQYKNQLPSVIEVKKDILFYLFNVVHGGRQDPDVAPLQMRILGRVAEQDRVEDRHEEGEFILLNVHQRAPLTGTRATEEIYGHGETVMDHFHRTAPDIIQQLILVQFQTIEGLDHPCVGWICHNLLRDGYGIIQVHYVEITDADGFRVPGSSIRHSD